MNSQKMRDLNFTLPEFTDIEIRAEFNMGREIDLEVKPAIFQFYKVKKQDFEKRGPGGF